MGLRGSEPLFNSAGNLALLTGSHTLSLVYSVIVGTQTVSSSGVTNTFDDGISNLDELDQGSDLAVTSYYIGGTITGLVGTGAVLQIDVGDDLTLTGDGSFNFIPAVADSTSYTATVLTQPSSPAQTCTVTNGAGAVSGANVTNVQVICSCILGSSLIGSCTLE